MNQDHLSSARRVAYLITGFIRNDLTTGERAELNEWIAESDDNMKLFGRLTDHNNILEAQQWFESIDRQAALERFTKSIQKEKSPVKKMYPAWIAAACIIVIISGVALLTSKKEQVQVTQQENLKHDSILIIPGAKKAVLVNEQGKTFDLSQPENNFVAIDDNSQAANNHSVLHYSAATSTARMHTLQTPRGGEYQLILPDGTHVWLNAESSLTYPTAFVSQDRVVELRGEAYFEVSPDKQKPFHVIVNNNTRIEVLGTHFNVNAYANSTEKISLLEGRIDVWREKRLVKMVPGQQLLVAKDNVQLLKDRNLRSAVAWTTGKFSFDKTPVSEVMEQVSRWYDVEVDYKGNVRQEFTGEIFRNSSLDQVLRMLQLSTGEHFTVQRRTIIVRP